MQILLLAGGTSNEREISLKSGAMVTKALEAAGHEVVVADPKQDKDLKSLTSSIDVIFIALHGSGGEDGTLQTELERLNVPFVGCGSEASKLCFDKAAYKQFLADHDLSSVSGRTVTAENLGDDDFSKPYVLKPIHGGSCLDTQIVRKPDQSSLDESKGLLQAYEQMLLEPLIEGVEITVGVLDDKALPVIEIIPPDGSEFDYENRYNGATQELCPPLHVSESSQHEARQLAEKIHKLTGCRQISRTDMIIDRSGTIHVLETNTIPGFTDQSLYPKMAAAVGINFPALVDQLVRNAVA